jgi:hypothetical protein
LGAGAGGGDVNNLLSDGGFDADATTGTDGLTCTTGTCSQETTNPFVGDGALKIALSAQAADVVKCYDNTNAQWDNQMIQIEGYLKSSAEFDFCYWDGTAEGNCETYGGSDDWQKVKIIESVQTENSICWKIKSASITDDIFADVTSIFSLKVDGTTKIETETLSFNADSSTMTDRSGATDLRWGSITESGDDLINYDDSTGRFIALKKVDLNLSWGGTSGTTTAFDIRKNGTVITRCSDAANFEQTCPINVILNEGDYITMQSAIVLTGAATLNAVAKHYEQKSVLSDATAESTVTQWKSFSPVFSGGWGAVTDVDFEWRRDGPDVLIRGQWSNGTVSAQIASIDLPFDNQGNQMVVASSVPTNAVLGTYGNSNTSADNNYVVATGGDANFKFTRSNQVPTNVSAVFNSGEANRFIVRIPIEGWDAKPQIVGTFRPKVRETIIRQATAQAASTDTTIDYDTVVYDPDGNFDLGNDHYVVPEDGVYHVSASVFLTTGTAGYREIYLRNKTTATSLLFQRNTDESASTNSSLVVNGTFRLNKDDQIEARFGSNAAVGTITTTNEVTSFRVFKVDQAGTIGGNEPTVKYDSGNFGTLGSTTAFVFTDTGANVDLTVGTWHITANTTVYMAGCSGTGVQGRFAYGEITDSSNNVIQDINGTVVRKSGEGICQSGSTNLGQIEIDAVVNITTAGNYKFRFSSYENSTSTTITALTLYDSSSYGSTTLKAVKY